MHALFLTAIGLQLYTPAVGLCLCLCIQTDKKNATVALHSILVWKTAQEICKKFSSAVWFKLVPLSSPLENC